MLHHRETSPIAHCSSPTLSKIKWRFNSLLNINTQRYSHVSVCSQWCLNKNCQKYLHPAPHGTRNAHPFISIILTGKPRGPHALGSPEGTHFLHPHLRLIEWNYLKVFWTPYFKAFPRYFCVHSSLTGPNFLFCIEVFNFHAKTPVLFRRNGH